MMADYRSNSARPDSPVVDPATPVFLFVFLSGYAFGHGSGFEPKLHT
jgi:hypothetical protein